MVGTGTEEVTGIEVVTGTEGSAGQVSTNGYIRCILLGSSSGVVCSYPAIPQYDTTHHMISLPMVMFLYMAWSMVSLSLLLGSFCVKYASISSFALLPY